MEVSTFSLAINLISVAILAYYTLANNHYLSRVEAHQRFNDQYSRLEFNEGDDYKRVVEVMGAL